jgi:hypothetical protein
VVVCLAFAETYEAIDAGSCMNSSDDGDGGIAW